MSNVSGGTATGLQTATTTVSVSGATAPTIGQVLTATSGTVATWQTPSSGGSNFVYIPICSGIQGAGSTYQVIGVVPPLTYSALVSGTPVYTFSAIVNIPASSTAQVVLYDKTNSTALYTSSIISGLQTEHNFTSTVTPASGVTLLELWLSTPTNLGGNATCLGSGIIVT
jgi:hypothetical protein